MSLPIRFLLYLIMPAMASAWIGFCCAMGLHYIGAPGWITFPMAALASAGSCWGGYVLLDRLTIK